MWALVTGIISIVVGIMVILKPELLSYIVGLYLIVVGALAVTEYVAWLESGSRPRGWHGFTGYGSGQS